MCTESLRLGDFPSTTHIWNTHTVYSRTPKLVRTADLALQGTLAGSGFCSRPLGASQPASERTPPSRAPSAGGERFPWFAVTAFGTDSVQRGLP